MTAWRRFQHCRFREVEARWSRRSIPRHTAIRQGHFPQGRFGPMSEWPQICQERSLGKVNWTASVITDPQRPIKARAIPSAPGGPLNLFKPGVVKVVPEPPKQCRTGCHFNRAYLNPGKQAHAVLRWELVIRRYLRIRNVVEPVGCILAPPGTPSTSSRLSGKIKRGPTHWYTK